MKNLAEIKKRLLKNFTQEFGIHFKGKGELGFALVFIEEALDQVAKEMGKAVKGEYKDLSQDDFYKHGEHELMRKAETFGRHSRETELRKDIKKFLK